MIGRAQQIPTNSAIPTLSFSPLILSVSNRPIPLRLRMTIPISGSRLPIILLSHGQGASNNLYSLNGYGPLVNFWASHGFAVIQPTHLLPKAVKIEEEGMVDGPQHWQSRVEDFKSILDQENEIKGAFQAAKGRLDWNRVAVVGHSMGSHIA
ncbi:hypothetical protein WAI453_011974 [Rhynchosporium graminicola]